MARMQKCERERAASTEVAILLLTKWPWVGISYHQSFKHNSLGDEGGAKKSPQQCARGRGDGSPMLGTKGLFQEQEIRPEQ